ncbi:MAG: alpha/beta hydrolase [Terracidiphilus sp.]
MRMHKISFTVAVTAISRTFVLRDRVLRLARQRKRGGASLHADSRHSIVSGDRLLDAIFVSPAGAPPQAALLICHGIAETVEHWAEAQHLLAAQGVASLVFDYSGYGKSTGAVDWSQCERDAIAAFEFLKTLAPGLPVSILGFSMGSGVATAILDRIKPERLILCAAFTSFRDAARALGVPRRVSDFLPPIWNGEKPLHDCPLPVLIVYGERDHTFPLKMSSRLAAWCGANAELVVVPGHRHNEPFSRPQLKYWSHIVSHLVPHALSPLDS